MDTCRPSRSLRWIHAYTYSNTDSNADGYADSDANSDTDAYDVIARR
jgi:hypothetical protein